MMKQSVRDKFNQWWDHSITGAPMMRIVAVRDTPTEPLEAETPFATAKDQYTNVDEMSLRFRNYLRTREYLAEAYPDFSVNLGAGSMALYLGSEPDFHKDTIWFSKTLEGDLDQCPPFRYDENAPWLKEHLSLIRRAVELAGDRYLVTVPDIVENLDILAAMRGPQELCYDMFDFPDAVQSYVDAIDDMYFKYYDQFYDLVGKTKDGCSYTAFAVWGEGKVAKVQCDYAAILNPAQFRRYVQPSLRRQTRQLARSIYHLDGAEEIRHVDALMEIESLNAIQWTHGAYHPDALDEKWYSLLYDKVLRGGKSMELIADTGNVDDWIRGTDKLLQRYTSRGLYILYPEMSMRDAEKLLKAADTMWK